jgi:hypothetical protein
MAKVKYKFKTTTIIKIYTLGIIVNSIVLLPIYFYSNSYKSSFIGIPLCLFIFFLSYRLFIARAKNRGDDINKPI